MISAELEAALQAWNDVGVKIFDGRDPRPIEEWKVRAYVELASFLAKKVQCRANSEQTGKSCTGTCLIRGPGYNDQPD